MLVGIRDVGKHVVIQHAPKVKAGLNVMLAEIGKHVAILFWLIDSVPHFAVLRLRLD